MERKCGVSNQARGNLRQRKLSAYAIVGSVEVEAFFLESNEVDISASEHHGGHKPFQFELLIPAHVMLKARAL